MDSINSNARASVRLREPVRRVCRTTPILLQEVRNTFQVESGSYELCIYDPFYDLSPQSYASSGRPGCCRGHGHLLRSSVSAKSQNVRAFRRGWAPVREIEVYASTGDGTGHRWLMAVSRCLHPEQLHAVYKCMDNVLDCHRPSSSSSWVGTLPVLYGTGGKRLDQS